MKGMQNYILKCVNNEKNTNMEFQRYGCGNIFENIVNIIKDVKVDG